MRWASTTWTATSAPSGGSTSGSSLTGRASCPPRATVSCFRSTCRRSTRRSRPSPRSRPDCGGTPCDWRRPSTALRRSAPDPSSRSVVNGLGIPLALDVPVLDRPDDARLVRGPEPDLDLVAALGLQVLQEEVESAGARLRPLPAEQDQVAQADDGRIVGAAVLQPSLVQLGVGLER